MIIEYSEIGMLEVESFYQGIVDELALVQSDSYTLDFEHVEVLSLCAIQVILSLKKYCDESNITLHCININSSAIQQTLITYNLQKTFGIDL